MKNSIKYIITVCCTLIFFACKKDNYAPPSDILTGNLLYNKDTIYLERNAVHFQIFQYGFGQVGPISTDETFAQNGSYSAALFNGDYKLIIPGGDGPFLSKTDSIAITMKGNQTVDIDVTPYYMIRNAKISASNRVITATFGAQKIVTDANAKDIESANLYVNATQFASNSDYLTPPLQIPKDSASGKVVIDGSTITNPNSITISYRVPSISNGQKYVYARVGLKIAGVEDLIYSPLFRIDL